MKKSLVCAALIAAVAGAQAQPAAATPASKAAPAKVSATQKALAARVLKAQQPFLENMAAALVQQPAGQLMQSASRVLQNMPADKREAAARDVEADARKYIGEVTPLAKARVVKLAPGVIEPMLEERFSEDELRQIATILESPVYIRYQSMGPDIQKAMSAKLVADMRGEVEPKFKAMELAMSNHLGLPKPSAAAPGAAPAKK
ncbi:MAG: hypothetical protein KGI36_07645 [Burkholderiales bacterium]|nr:hypothetical protein [Burkholderiales bacterium]